MNAPDLTAVLRHAETYESVRDVISHITSSRALDDELYAVFRAKFPTANVQDLSTSKRVLQKPQVWAAINTQFKGRIPDPSLATLQKINLAKGMNKSNAQLVTRMVWLAIEVARLKERGTQA